MSNKDFETWAQSRFTPGTIGFGVKENGKYMDLYTNFMFEAWQAARSKYKPKWISVDTPPENSTWVMIKTTSPLTNEPIVTMAFYEFNEESNETYWLEHYNELEVSDGWEDVTHWMTLPEPTIKQGDS